MPELHKHAVMQLDELPVGSRKIISLNDQSIGLFNVQGEVVAILNLCPHELAPVCQGQVSGTTLPSLPGEPFKWGHVGEIIRCPWHGWEFNLLTGTCLTDRRKLRRFPVSIEDGWIQIHLR